MVLPQLSIRRPVLATVVSLIIVLVGLICYKRLAVRQIPNIDTPVVSVNTSYPGANASVIESQITKPIEDAIAGIEGVDYMTSTSRAEESSVTVVFKLERDAGDAASDVRDRVNQARELLPVDAHDPIVQKQEADAQPIIWLAFSSDRHSRLEVADYAQRLVKDRLQAIPGVAQARLYASQYAMRIWLIRAHGGLRRHDGRRRGRLRRQNVEIPAGRIESQSREFTVLAQTDLTTEEQFRDVILRDQDGYLVRLGDVARVELGADNQRFIGRFNGNPTVPLGIVKQSVANPLDIAKAVRDALPLITAQMPEGMKVEMGTTPPCSSRRRSSRCTPRSWKPSLWSRSSCSCSCARHAPQSFR
jgi:multidrug efflux pump